MTTDPNLVRTFTELLDASPDRWEKEGPLVCRSAFHAGSLAGFRAYNRSGRKVLKRADVIAALEYIRPICTAGVQLEYAYCRLLPKP